MVKYPHYTSTFGNINPKNELAFIANWRKTLEFPSLWGDSNFHYPISGAKDVERDNLYRRVLQNGIFSKKKKNTVTCNTTEVLYIILELYFNGPAAKWVPRMV